MTINFNDKNTNAIFNDVDEGECFLYNGSFYIMAHDKDRDTEYFGVNLANGAVRDFDSCDEVQVLTAEVTFKELS